MGSRNYWTAPLTTTSPPWPKLRKRLNVGNFEIIAPLWPMQKQYLNHNIYIAYISQISVTCIIKIKAIFKPWELRKNLKIQTPLPSYKKVFISECRLFIFSTDSSPFWTHPTFWDIFWGAHLHKFRAMSYCIIKKRGLTKRWERISPAFKCCNQV